MFRKKTDWYHQIKALDLEKATIFDSGLSIVKANEGFKIYYPIVYVGLIQTLNRVVDGYEYSFFGKINKIAGNKIFLEEDYYIPEQEVSHSSVKYKEKPPEGWDVVVHRHPFQGGGFSATDETYINANFIVSLLINNDTITQGVFNVKNQDYILQVNAIPTIYIQDAHCKEEEIRKIQKQISYSYDRNWNRDWL